MSDQSRQNDLITSFVDDELAPGDIDRLLSELESEAHRSRVQRQLMLRQLLGGSPLPGRDISSAVRAAIAAEAAPVSAGRTVVAFSARRARWIVPTTGLALAASAALAAVMLTQPPSTANPQPVMTAQQPASGPGGEAASGMQVASARSSAPQSPSAGAGDASDNELVIAAPGDSRPVTAQWSSAGTDQNASSRSPLNSYLINHARYGGGYGLAGSLSYARITAQGTQVTAESRE